MLPMQCPKCCSRNYRVLITNNNFDAQTIRKRRCAACGHVWFTVEMEVNRYAMGWSGLHHHKPVVRVAVELRPEVTPGGLADQPHEEL